MSRVRWLHTSALRSKLAQLFASRTLRYPRNMAEEEAQELRPSTRPEGSAWAMPRLHGGRLVFAVVAVALLAVLLFFWMDTRGRITSTQDEVAKQLRELDLEVREARSQARRAQDLVQELQGRVSQFDAKVSEYQSQQAALEALYQELSRSRDEWQLAEVEQVLTIAQQQLQLSGNVRAALLALELAESRLARTDRPQFLPVRRALTRDIERLKAAPALDLPGMSFKLDRLIGSADTLPLAFEERAERAVSRPAGTTDGRVLERLGFEIWNELKQLVVVRRIDTAEAPLLAPSQAYFLRENLRLRLLNARLSLLNRDEAGYREDMRAAQAWIRRYFDPRGRQVGEVLAQIRQLDSASLSFDMPSIAESLEAVRSFKSRREKKT
jgi:uroporphyrin-3 C-methyltransferase